MPNFHKKEHFLIFKCNGGLLIIFKKKVICIKNDSVKIFEVICIKNDSVKIFEVVYFFKIKSGQIKLAAFIFWIKNF